MNLEIITSVNPVVPKKGTNAGRTMFVINGKHWSRTEPSSQDTHLVLEDVDVDGNTYTNVIGFSRDSRMDIYSKIKMLTEYEPGYAMAIATLLK
jgi:hypothetical protein